MEILESLEMQVKRWIAAWELCAKDIDTPIRELDMPAPKATKPTKNKITKPETPESSEDTSEPEPSESTSEEEEDSSSGSASEEDDSNEDEIPTTPPNLGFNEINGLVNKFRKFGVEAIPPVDPDSKPKLAPKRKNRALGKTHTGIRSK
eukprot:CAMPEP_0117043218 /NCGR_PEP_ID=MMETSP0472-20121206/30060_1 /TAXON_ID=693140 ORGANISM="Tiarina fusus, Strain LIS" /NCGR_SAMPLE_ID=MMETSP0472 /ASSEMBLY_ACC=CAM_ASM_000603 /LENGTH=148 /DNA_ID=CAMNT_0004754691 /DNA_START=186 /DNA_END=632 /DNA_ORIENTATION=+